MKLSKLQVVIRERNQQEWRDLGIPFWRHNFKAIAMPWMACTVTWALLCVVVLLVCHALGYWNNWVLFLVPMGFVWPLPMAERLVIASASQCLFDEKPSTVYILKNWRKYQYKTWYYLFFLGRISRNRGFLYPVEQLEGLSGKPCRARRCVLNRFVGWAQYGTGYWFGFLEILITVALLVWLLNPLQILGFNTPSTSLGIDPSYIPLWLMVCLFVIYASAIILVRPIMLCCHFMQYIGARVYIEAWDIQVGFASLSQRHQENKNAVNLKEQKKNIKPSHLFFSLMLSLCLLPMPSQAQQPAMQANVSEQAIQQELEEIYAQDTYDYVVKVGKDDNLEGVKARKTSGRFDLAYILAFIFKFLLILCLIAGLIFVVYVLVRYNKGMNAQIVTTTKKKPRFVAGFDLQQQEEYISGAVAQVRLFYNNGDLRKAMALMYVSCLKLFVYEQHLSITNGATEMECLRVVLVKGTGDLPKFFDALTPNWIQIAYSDQPLEPYVVAQHIDAFEIIWPSEAGS